jgi:hypothetical protein
MEFATLVSCRHLAGTRQDSASLLFQGFASRSGDVQSAMGNSLAAELISSGRHKVAGG